MAQASSTGKPNGEQKIWAMASYLWILSVVVLAARTKNQYIRFHANQGVLIFVLSLASFLTGPFMPLVNIVLAGAALMGMYRAFQGEKWEVPVIGKFATKIGDWVVKTLKL